MAFGPPQLEVHQRGHDDQRERQGKPLTRDDARRTVVWSINSLFCWCHLMCECECVCVSVCVANQEQPRLRSSCCVSLRPQQHVSTFGGRLVASRWLGPPAAAPGPNCRGGASFVARRPPGRWGRTPLLKARSQRFSSVAHARHALEPRPLAGVAPGAQSLLSS